MHAPLNVSDRQLRECYSDSDLNKEADGQYVTNILKLSKLVMRGDSSSLSGVVIKQRKI